MTAQILYPHFVTRIPPDPVSGLREIADQIEAGAHGEVVAVGIVIRSSKGTELFGLGPDSTMPMLACLHAEAARIMGMWSIKDITPGSTL